HVEHSAQGVQGRDIVVPALKARVAAARDVAVPIEILLEAVVDDRMDADQPIEGIGGPQGADGSLEPLIPGQALDQRIHHPATKPGRYPSIGVAVPLSE